MSSEDDGKVIYVDFGQHSLDRVQEPALTPVREVHLVLRLSSQHAADLESFMSKAGLKSWGDLVRRGIALCRLILLPLKAGEMLTIGSPLLSVSFMGLFQFMLHVRRYSEITSRDIE